MSFRREKFVPYGGPDGGDGGKGGDVVIAVDATLTDLRLFKHKRYYRAGKGEPGKDSRKHGRNGEVLELAVPVGTVVSYKTQIGEKTVLADLAKPGERVVAARGGKGGRGNVHFASSTNQAPRVAQRGEPGEEQALILEVRLIADVGIIGFPNAGKSTLLAAASAAKPEIAGYEFTTRSPVLGVVEVGQQAFVLAEIPGLISGAHRGRGLGHDFLRHVSRTRLLIHLIDGTSPSPVESMMQVNAELGLYDSALVQKRQVVAVNKIDLPEVRTRRAEIEESFTAIGVGVFFISAQGKEGVSVLMSEALKMLGERRQPEVTAPPKRVFHPQPRVATPTVHRDGDTFVVVAPEMERIAARMDETSPLLGGQLKKPLQRLGITRALTRAGVKPGDRVRCGNLEWEWD